jgi:hypothetical protein
MLAIVKKYKELIDVMLIAFPYIKRYAKENCGLVVPTLTKENEDIKLKLKSLFKI